MYRHELKSYIIVPKAPTSVDRQTMRSRPFPKRGQCLDVVVQRTWPA